AGASAASTMYRARSAARSGESKAGSFRAKSLWSPGVPKAGRNSPGISKARFAHGICEFESLSPARGGPSPWGASWSHKSSRHARELARASVVCWAQFFGFLTAKPNFGHQPLVASFQYPYSEAGDSVRIHMRRVRYSIRSPWRCLLPRRAVAGFQTLRMLRQLAADPCGTENFGTVGNGSSGLCWRSISGLRARPSRVFRVSKPGQPRVGRHDITELLDDVFQSAPMFVIR